MEPRTLLDFMGMAERLKCNMRHSRTAEYLPSVRVCMAGKRRIPGL